VLCLFKNNNKKKGRRFGLYPTKPMPISAHSWLIFFGS
jgi:hypothetical protein